MQHCWKCDITGLSFIFSLRQVLHLSSRSSPHHISQDWFISAPCLRHRLNSYSHYSYIIFPHSLYSDHGFSQAFAITLAQIWSQPHSHHSVYPDPALSHVLTSVHNLPAIPVPRSWSRPYALHCPCLNPILFSGIL